MSQHKATDSDLTRTVEAIQAETIDVKAENEAYDRVWHDLSREAEGAPALTPPEVEAGGVIASCAQFQALIPAYLSHELTSARRLLVEDHTRECIPCRKALQAARSGETRAGAGTLGRELRPRGVGPVLRRVLAASVVALVGAVSFYLWTGPLAPAERDVAEVKAVDGHLSLVTEAGPRALALGDWLDEGQEVRTARGSGAVLQLADGSTVEMDERSTLSLRVRRDETRIQVRRGNIIVEAAPQGEGVLTVATPDCLVSVKGTVFAVRLGTKGSRVSVFDGEVQVEHGQEAKTLYPGDQLATHGGVTAVPLASEIDWSRDFDRYIGLLHEFSNLRQELNQLVARPDPRFSTRLLDLAPASTAVYVAIPNLTTAVTEARRLLDERLSANPQLRSWWDENVVSSGFDAQLDELLERLRAFGDNLGDEIVVTLSRAENRGVRDPLVLAEVTNSMALEAALVEEAERLARESNGNFQLQILVDPLAETQGDDADLLVWIFEDLFVASPNLEPVQGIAAILSQGQKSPFVGSEFHAQLAASYAQGAEFLAGVDLSVFLAWALAEEGASEAALLEESGLLDAKHILLERKQTRDEVQSAAVLSFDGPRSGIASWLAPPSAMGSLDFISADADVAFAMVVKEPRTIVDELLELLALAQTGVEAELAELETRYGLNLRDDIAAPLGGEVAFAHDGPALPQPSWKLIVEVYDPVRLQNTLEWIVEQINAELERNGGEGKVQLTRTEVGGETFYQITSSLTGASEIHYVFVDGYLVMTPSQVLLDRALRFKEAQATLLTSPEFQALLPEDGFLNFSALLYQNLGALVDAGLKQLAQAGDALSAEQRQTLAQLDIDSGPSLVCAYGEEDRIRVTSRSEGGLLDFATGGSFFPLLNQQQGVFGSLLPPL